MNVRDLIASKVLLGVVLVASACAQDAPPKPEPPVAPPSPPQQRPAAVPSVRSEGPARSLGAAQAAAEPARAVSDYARQVNTLQKGYSIVGVSAGDRPVLLVTEPISKEVETEMKEDLVVMDKLLGDEVVRAGGGAVAPHAMGIKLMSLAATEPTYIEGLGAVFHYRVNMPLAGQEGGNGQTRPAGPPSAWDRAKRELAIRSTDGKSVKTWSAKIELAPYDPSRVEELRQMIVKTLPEAKNIRHLKDGDVIIVTIAGTDDAAQPVRMTLKAKKSDIDQAATGAISADEFAQRVAQRIG